MSAKRNIASVPVEPKETDILSGRGKATYTHPGNKRYLQVINLAIDEYISETTKVGKTAIVRGIVQQMSKEHRLFLQRDSKTNEWYELDRKAVLDKVGHSLRDMKQTKIQGKPTEQGDAEVSLSALAGTNANNKLSKSSGTTLASAGGQSHQQHQQNSSGNSAILASTRGVQLSFGSSTLESKIPSVAAAAGINQALHPHHPMRARGFPGFHGLGGYGGPSAPALLARSGIIDQRLLTASRSSRLGLLGAATHAAQPTSKLDEILEATSMILKEREAIRALSASAALGLSAAAASQSIATAAAGPLARSGAGSVVVGASGASNSAATRMMAGAGGTAALVRGVGVVSPATAGSAPVGAAATSYPMKRPLDGDYSSSLNRGRSAGGVLCADGPSSLQSEKPTAADKLKSLTPTQESLSPSLKHGLTRKSS